MSEITDLDNRLINVMVAMDELSKNLLARIHLNLLLGKPTKPLFDILDSLVGGTPEDKERKRKRRELEEHEERRMRALPHALKAVDISQRIYGASSHEHQLALANAERLAVRGAP